MFRPTILFLLVLFMVLYEPTNGSPAGKVYLYLVFFNIKYLELGKVIPEEVGNDVDKDRMISLHGFEDNIQRDNEVSLQVSNKLLSYPDILNTCV